MGLEMSKAIKSAAVALFLGCLFSVTGNADEAALRSSDAVTQCKQQNGIWRWASNLPKSSGECIFRAPDAEKVCTDDDQCFTHNCRAVYCISPEKCAEQKSGKCYSFTGQAYGCDYHFRKGTLQTGPCVDPARMLTDPAKK
jgi:hypothetical protein